jgi:hypothetical protein
MATDLDLSPHAIDAVVKLVYAPGRGLPSYPETGKLIVGHPFAGSEPIHDVRRNALDRHLCRHTVSQIGPYSYHFSCSPEPICGIRYSCVKARKQAPRTSLQACLGVSRRVNNC